MRSICGIDCAACPLGAGCGGCLETGGRPFGGTCVTAECRRRGETVLAEFKERLIAAFRALDIPDMEEVTDLNALKGSFINLEYALPGGQAVKLWDDDRIYLGNQLRKTGSDRCYGLAADETYLLVSEYGENGADAEIVVFKRWNQCSFQLGSAESCFAEPSVQIAESGRTPIGG